jgi:uncharacterized protein involved in exopolysaccharide biosynthesis
MAVLLRRRWRIAGVTLLFGLIGLGVVFLRPRTYTATFSLVPQALQDDARAGLANLASQFGLIVPAAQAQLQSPQMYADLITSREILTPLAQDTFSLDARGGIRTTLTQALEVEGPNETIRLERTIRAMRRRMVPTPVVDRTTGVVTARVTTSSPALSLQVAEGLIQGLHHFNIVTRQSQASTERRFIEDRLANAQSTLRAAEDSLKAFLVANRQLQNSPELTFQHDRLEREVLLQEQIVTALAQQFEEARIREVRDTPVITLIEKPLAPALPDSRGGAVILALSLLVGFFVGAAWGVLGDELARIRSRESPDLAELRSEWARARGRG